MSQGLDLKHIQGTQKATLQFNTRVHIRHVNILSSMYTITDIFYAAYPLWDRQTLTPMHKLE